MKVVPRKYGTYSQISANLLPKFYFQTSNILKHKIIISSINKLKKQNWESFPNDFHNFLIHFFLSHTLFNRSFFLSTPFQKKIHFPLCLPLLVFFKKKAPNFFLASSSFRNISKIKKKEWGGIKKKKKKTGVGYRSLIPFFHLHTGPYSLFYPPSPSSHSDGFSNFFSPEISLYCFLKNVAGSEESIDRSAGL